MDNEPKEKTWEEEERVKFGWKDILAIMIAQFQILFPLAIGAVVIAGLLLLFLMKVWLKQ